MVEADLLRLIATELHYANMQSTAQEMFSKGLYELNAYQLNTLGRYMLPVLMDIF